MIVINETITIPDSDLQYEFVRATGPGGQNINKVSTAVQLRFDAGNAEYFDEAEKVRLRKLAGRRMTAEGILIIEARRFRSQAKNREDAENRLVLLIQKALARPKIRRKAKPSRAAAELRLAKKKKQSEKKKERRSRTELDE